MTYIYYHPIIVSHIYNPGRFDSKYDYAMHKYDGAIYKCDTELGGVPTGHANWSVLMSPV